MTERTAEGSGLRVTVTFTNHNPATIWNRLALRLGRQPTNAEATGEVRRILRGEPAPVASGGGS